MKCGQCGFNIDVPPEGGGEFLCPNCGFLLRKSSAPADGGEKNASPRRGSGGLDSKLGPANGGGKPSSSDTATGTHLKIAKTVNVGFGDFASVLAATDASKIVATDTSRDLDRTRTASASTLKVEAPDDDDDALSQLDVYDEDDEYARIQADIAARVKALDIRAIELDAREKHLNKKLDEIIAEKEFLRTGIEKSDREHAAYLKQKDALDAQRIAMEKELAARKASLDARAAEIDRKNETLGKTRASLEKLKRELDAAMSGDQAGVDHTASSVSIPYSAKLLRMNSKLERAVRIQKRILICLAILAAVLVALLFVKESELRRHRTVQERSSEQTNANPEETTPASAPNPASAGNGSSPADSSAPATSPENEKSTAPENGTPGGGS